MSIAKKIYQEALKLPEPLAQEVLDFIEYIEKKHGILGDNLSDIKNGQETALKGLWDNSEDEIWNDL